MKNVVVKIVIEDILVNLILESLILDDEIKEIINGNCNSVRLYEYFKKTEMKVYTKTDYKNCRWNNEF